MNQVDNSRFTNEKRDVEKMKKKFFNIKQRAKEKIDSARKAKTVTGGGPPPPEPTPAEEAIINVCGERPGMKGLPSSIDSDAIAESNKLTERNSDNDNPSTNATADNCEEQGPSSIENALVDKPVSSKYISRMKAKQSLKRKSSDIDELTIKNLKLDNQRLESQLQLQQIQKEVLKQTSETYKSVKNAADSVYLYFSMKSSVEFNVGFNPEV